MTVEVLMVCTGNLHRSPLAERLAASRSRVAETEVHFSSCGTHAPEGLAMDAAAAMALRQLGGDPAGHIARLLTGPMVEQAALVLTATSEQRDLVARKRPAARVKCFTLKEFVRLGADVAPAAGPDDVGRLIREVAAQREPFGSAASGRDQIADPHGANLSETLRCALEIGVAVDGVLNLLGIHEIR
jgi:protein-tyrosine phosphatase